MVQSKRDIFGETNVALLRYFETPIQEIQDATFSKAGIRVYIKREDQNHPFVSGNKWWKLKYNLQEASRLGMRTLLTYGGAYSNHIYATAAAALETGFNAIGIIRGEEATSHNPVIQFARMAGMKLHFISRELYKTKDEVQFIERLHDTHGEFYLIPEGGSNDLAVAGVQEFVRTIRDDFDYICCPVGTGGTLAGLINGFKGSRTIIGFSVLKDGSFLYDEVRRLNARFDNWSIRTDYDFGGYAKATPWLTSFIRRFQEEHGIPIEHVYTAKMIAGVFDLIDKGFFRRGSSVLIVHTGGIHKFTDEA